MADESNMLFLASIHVLERNQVDMLAFNFVCREQNKIRSVYSNLILYVGGQNDITI